MIENTMSNANKRPAGFDYVMVGEELTQELVCNEEWLKSFTFSADDGSGLYQKSAGEQRLAPSAGVARDLMLLFLKGYDTSQTAGLHQRQDIWYHGPVPFGAKLTLTGRYTNKYVKRDKGYVVFESEALDEQGSVLVRQRSVEIMTITPGIRTSTSSAEPPADKIVGLWPENTPTVDTPDPGMALPAPIPELYKVLSQDVMSVFSGVGTHRTNIHNNLEKAQRYGFQKCVAAGMMEACWMSELATRFFGLRFLENGHVSSIFLSPIYTGDVVACRGVVTNIAKESAQDRFDLELWCQNQEAVRTAVGRASCTLISRESSECLVP